LGGFWEYSDFWRSLSAGKPKVVKYTYKMQENTNYLLPLIIVSLSGLIVGLISLAYGIYLLKRKEKQTG